MAQLFKRSNGIYYIRYEEDGKTKWKSTSSATMAEGPPFNAIPSDERNAGIPSQRSPL
jgi:hypothetical protein